jgi:hypothetical protein
MAVTEEMRKYMEYMEIYGTSACYSNSISLSVYETPSKYTHDGGFRVK